MTDLQLKQKLAALLEEKELRNKYNKIDTIFPDSGQYARELYPKHLLFMASGKKYRQRAFIAANRTGKTVCGAYEMACHLTGLYPDWWEGKRFDKQVSAWAASKSNQVTKEVMQLELLGSIMDQGTGMIPKHLIERTTKKPGVADAVETIYVRHTSGGISELTFKSYDQGRETFQGTKKQVIWLDEEPTDPNIFSECLTRTAGGDGMEGIIYCTFTPLFGLSDVVMSFLPDGKMPENGVDPNNPHKFVINVTWEEVPHLSKNWTEEALASFSPHEKAARSQGTPSLGSGAIYPYAEDEVSVDPFKIPVWWPRAYGLDVGWNRTAAVWGAEDPDTRQIYIYSEHYVGQEKPAVHASAIKERGDWICGAIDPRSDSKGQADGLRLIDLYQEEGLILSAADNSVEAGIAKIGQLFAGGQLKIFKTCTNLLSEFRIYRRDERGKIIKKNDHAMDAMRYLIMSGMHFAQTMPDMDIGRGNEDDNSRSNITGY